MNSMHSAKFFTCLFTARKRNLGQGNVLLAPVILSTRGRGSLSGGLPHKDPLDRDPLDRDPQIKTTPSQRHPWTETPWTETVRTETPDTLWT